MNFWEFYKILQEEEISHNKPNSMLGYGKTLEEFLKKHPRCKMLYIGGFSSTGNRAAKAEAYGFEVVAPKFTDSMLAVATGKIAAGSNSLPAQLLHKLTFNAVEKQWSKLKSIALESAEGFEPDIIIGTSQGGAIAMEVSKHKKNAQLILLAPAWKIYNVEPKVPSDTIIYHGTKDNVIPLQNSIELSEINGCRLIRTGEGHRLKKAEELAMKEAMEIARHLNKYPGVKPDFSDIKPATQYVNPNTLNKTHNMKMSDISKNIFYPNAPKAPPKAPPKDPNKDSNRFYPPKGF